MSNLLFVYWPKCSTCTKGLKYLKEQNVSFITRDIMDETPTREEIKSWSMRSHIPLKKFFNSSGMMYRDLDLKSKVDSMSEDEILDLLTSSGRLIKRPILIKGDTVLLGFNEELYDDIM